MKLTRNNVPVILARTPGRDRNYLAVRCLSFKYCLQYADVYVVTDGKPTRNCVDDFFYSSPGDFSLRADSDVEFRHASSNLIARRCAGPGSLRSSTTFPSNRSTIANPSASSTTSNLTIGYLPIGARFNGVAHARVF